MPTKKPSKELLNKVTQNTNLIRTIENDFRKSTLIDKTLDLTIYERKIIAYLISKIKPGDDTFKPVTLKYSDFCKIMNITASGKSYKKISDSVENLFNKSFKVLTKDGDTVFFHWLEGEKTRIKGSKREVVLQLSNSLKPFLLNLTRDFTMYELGYVIMFKKKYTFRLYEFLKSHAGFGYCHYNIENFKNKVIGNQYQNIADIERYILEPAKEEINTFSDINISYNINKKYGEKGSHNPAETITFFITTKSNLEKFDIWKNLGFNADDLKKLKIVDNKGKPIEPEKSPKNDNEPPKTNPHSNNSFRKPNIDIECDSEDLKITKNIEIDFDENDLPF